MQFFDVKKVMLDLIRAYLNDRPWVEELPDEQLDLLLKMLKKHDIAHLGGIVFSKDLKNREKYNAFIKFQFVAIMRYEKGKYFKDKIYELFEEERIPFLPLKGAVICDYYPEPWHRTSCDVDILVREEHIKNATELLEQKLNFKYSRKSEHDVSLYSPDGVHVELHYDFHEENISVADAWQSASLIEGSKYHYVLPSEVFILHHIAHIAKHFKYGGCGVRFFVDLWIISHNMQFDKKKLNVLLEEKGLIRFAENALCLIETWFGQGNSILLTQEMSDYILGSGIYGSVENRVAIGQIKKKSNFRYAISRIFLPYNALKYRYQILEKKRWLMPFCQIHRWIELLKQGKIRNVNDELGINKDINEDRRRSISVMLSNLGLM